MPAHVTTDVKLKQLRDNVAAGRAKLDDYLELPILLFETNRFGEAVETLRHALDLPFGNVERAVLLTALGWYGNAVTGGRDESRALGEQAAALTEGLDTCEALAARAKAQALVADCGWLDDPVRSEEIAASALALFDRVLEADRLPASVDRYELLFESARVNCLLRRFEEGARRCGQALQAASDKYQECNSLVELGTIYRESGRLTEAREAFTRAVRVPDVAPLALVRPYYELGLTERALGKKAEARAKVRKGIDILQSDPALPRRYLPQLFLEEGCVSYELDDIEEAAKSFKAATDSFSVADPLHWSCLLWLARCDYDLGQLEAARTSATLVKQSPVASEEDRASADWLL